MAGNVSDFMKLWTQSDQASERKLQKFLLLGWTKLFRVRAMSFPRFPLAQQQPDQWCGGWEEWG